VTWAAKARTRSGLPFVDNGVMTLPSTRTARTGVALALLVAVALLPACRKTAPTNAVDDGGPLLPASPLALPQYSPAQFRRMLTQLQGKPVVLNVWASWCRPCIQEAPDLAAAAREFAGKAQFVGLDVLDQLSPARAFVTKFGIPFPSVFDPQTSIRSDLGLTGQPFTELLDATGKRVALWSGPTFSVSELRASLRRLTGS
jgi:cytochrome c biogenesis protein CcmG/thiol:disulfide interchange protein DsbE